MTFDASEGLSTFEWCTDASFAVHPDFRSHTGGLGKFGGGQGCPINVSTKQKLNADSSVTAELFPAGQPLPLVMWVPLFLAGQGHPTETNCVCQDNQSVILLEKNDKVSSSKRTQAINIHYFMVMDLMKRGELEIVHCPTENVIGCYFAKSLQGTKFSKSCRMIMEQE